MKKTLLAFQTALLLLVCLGCGAAALCLLRAPVFPTGLSYELYAEGYSGALTLQTDDPVGEKLRYVTAGESVLYEGDLREELEARYAARLLFTEQAGDVVNYYYSSPFIREEILLNGQRVNLHIAVGGNRTKAGAPIIFGGF